MEVNNFSTHHTENILVSDTSNMDNIYEILVETTLYNKHERELSNITCTVDPQYLSTSQSFISYIHFPLFNISISIILS
jgi:hypothetical protein